MKTMAARINIRKLLSFTVWCIVGAGVLVLLVAAIGYRNNKTCKGYNIEITGGGASGKTVLFIGKKDILEMLTHGPEKWTGKAMASFDLRRMEDVLEKNVWIRDAQLFFDNNGILRVNVAERVPVARVFTTEGNSYYVDSGGVFLPLSNRMATQLPVFTGYPGVAVAKLHGDDSLMAQQVRNMAAYIRTDSFWMAQIEQVDIRSDHTLQMVPTVGNHVVELGDGNDFQGKLHRLFLFYQQVLSRVGFDKYSRITVAYAGQVVGTKKGSEGTKQDSLQGMKNIQDLIRSAQKLEPDTARLAATQPLEKPVMTEQSLTSYDLLPGGDAGHPTTGGDAGHATAVGDAHLTVKPVANAKPGTANVKPGATNVKAATNGKPAAKVTSALKKPGRTVPATAPPKPKKQSHTTTKPKAIMPNKKTTDK